MARGPPVCGERSGEKVRIETAVLGRICVLVSTLVAALRGCASHHQRRGEPPTAGGSRRPTIKAPKQVRYVDGDTTVTRRDRQRLAGPRQGLRQQHHAQRAPQRRRADQRRSSPTMSPNSIPISCRAAHRRVHVPSRHRTVHGHGHLTVPSRALATTLRPAQEELKLRSVSPQAASGSIAEDTMPAAARGRSHLRPAAALRLDLRPHSAPDLQPELRRVELP